MSNFHILIQDITLSFHSHVKWITLWEINSDCCKALDWKAEIIPCELSAGGCNSGSYHSHCWATLYIPAVDGNEKHRARQPGFATGFSGSLPRGVFQRRAGAAQLCPWLQQLQGPALLSRAVSVLSRFLQLRASIRQKPRDKSGGTGSHLQ